MGYQQLQAAAGEQTADLHVTSAHLWWVYCVLPHIMLWGHLSCRPFIPFRNQTDMSLWQSLMYIWREMIYIGLFATYLKCAAGWPFRPQKALFGTTAVMTDILWYYGEMELHFYRRRTHEIPAHVLVDWHHFLVSSPCLISSITSDTWKVSAMLISPVIDCQISGHGGKVYGGRKLVRQETPTWSRMYLVCHALISMQPIGLMSIYCMYTCIWMCVHTINIQ